MTLPSLEHAIGQLMVVGFDGYVAPEYILDALRKGELAGVILFRRNVRDIEQVVALNTQLHQACADLPYPPLVCVDQEGGRVVRLRDPLTPVGTMRQLSQASPRLVSEVSEVVATELQSVGFNVNFAPVVDVDTNPDNPVIGDRAFGRDPERVGRLGGAWVVGHMMAGVLPCAKHFPGHGDTDTDSHLTLPTLTHDRERLQSIELRPFRRLVQGKVPLIMTAHIVATAWDPVYPATLSPAIIQGILRDQMGYDGVVVSDCMEMKAVSEFAPIQTLVEQSLRAGVDLFLISHTRQKWEDARAHLLTTAQNDEALHAHIMTAWKRVHHLKSSFFAHAAHPWEPQPNWRTGLGCEAHREVVERVAWQTPDILHDPTEQDADS